MAVGARDAGATGLCGRCAIKPAHLSHTKKLLQNCVACNSCNTHISAPFNNQNREKISTRGVIPGMT